MTRPAIRLDKLRDELRRMERGRLLEFCERAIELIPPAKLLGLAGDFVEIWKLRGEDGGPRPLLEEVRLFCEASLRGEYYEDFDVDSKNYMDQSRGTESFTAELNLLFGRCEQEAKKDPLAPVRQAFEMLFRLLRHVDEGNDDVVFFADEGGVWALEIDWRSTLPAYFRCLAETASPEAFAREVELAIKDFGGADRPLLLEAAHRVASAKQRRALRAAAPGAGSRVKRG